MILLDTHIWIWWVSGDLRLSQVHRTLLDNPATGELGISGFSCWEVAKLHELKRIVLPLPIDQWLHAATKHPRLQVIPVGVDVSISVAALPPGMHRDPADQIIVATARMLDCPLLTMDGLIRQYPHVKLYT